MIHLYDIADRCLPAGLRGSPAVLALLADRLDRLDAALLPWTEFVVVQPGDKDRDLIDALGHSPLVDPIDGHRWPDPRFEPGWDFVGAYPAAFQLNFSFGSAFGQIVLVERAADVLLDLLAMCSRYAAPG